MNSTAVINKELKRLRTILALTTVTAQDIAWTNQRISHLKIMLAQEAAARRTSGVNK